MSGMSKHLALAVFNMTLNPSRSPYALPSGIYLGLHTAAPDDLLYGSEASYGNYARAQISNMTSTVVAGLTADDWIIRCRNQTAITFNVSDGPDEIITHWAVWDNASKGQGNILYSGALGAPKTIVTGDAAICGDLQLVIDLS